MKNHFKALTCIAMSMCLVISCMITVSSVSATDTAITNSTSTQETITFDDGSYCVVTTTETPINSVTRGTTKTKGAKKTYNYYNAVNTLCWTYILHGTFMYDDYLVVCSDVSHEIAINTPQNWIYDSGKRWKQGNTAYGKATFRLIASSAKKTVNLEISCTKHGVIS